MRWKSHVGLHVANFVAVMERKQGQFMPPPPPPPKSPHSNGSSNKTVSFFAKRRKILHEKPVDASHNSSHESLWLSPGPVAI